MKFVLVKCALAKSRSTRPPTRDSLQRTHINHLDALLHAKLALPTRSSRRRYDENCRYFAYIAPNTPQLTRSIDQSSPHCPSRTRHRTSADRPDATLLRIPSLFALGQIQSEEKSGSEISYAIRHHRGNRAHYGGG